MMQNVTNDDAKWMGAALVEARLALAHDDVPVGAIAVLNGEIIGRGRNRREADRDPTAHAEIIAIQQAAAHIGHWRLDEVTLYCTLEPCTMCAAAISFARIRRLYYGARDPKGGAVESGVRFFSAPTCHHRPEVYGGIGESEAAALLKDFFKERR